MMKDRLIAQHEETILWQAKRIAELLDASQPPAPAPQRKPLTDDRVWLEYMQLWPFRPNDEPTLAKDILRFARAIEAAHGIKENT